MYVAQTLTTSDNEMDDGPQLYSVPPTWNVGSFIPKKREHDPSSSGVPAFSSNVSEVEVLRAFFVKRLA